jgi:hypothetical protein
MRHLCLGNKKKTKQNSPIPRAGESIFSDTTSACLDSRGFQPQASLDFVAVYRPHSTAGEQIKRFL